MKFGNVENVEDIDFSFPPLPLFTTSILQKVKSKEKETKFYFGAPVWSDKNYKGTLYPEKTPQSKFLQAYAKQFNSVELNATRYGVPKQTSLDKWKNETPDGFKFSMKFPQIITHRKDIMDDNSKEQMERFFSALDYMGDRNGVAFAVMANYFKPDKFDTLVNFVEYQPKELPIAIELRAEEWFSNQSIINEWHQLFLENNIIPVLTDTPGRRDVLHFRITNEHLFVRYVGKASSETDYFRIKQWAKRIIELTEKGITTIWFYAHVPGDNRREVVPFFNRLTEEINNISPFNLPQLVDYSQG